MTVVFDTVRQATQGGGPMNEFKLDDGGILRIFNLKAVQSCLTPPHFFLSSWRSIINRLIFVSGTVALMAVASGANLGPELIDGTGLQFPKGKNRESAPVTYGKCDEGNLFKQVLNLGNNNCFTLLLRGPVPAKLRKWG